MSVLIQTSFGDLEVDLWTEKCPKASLNFIKLCKIKHYNNALFIEVQKNHIARVATQNPTTIWQTLSHRDQDRYFSDQTDHQLKFKETGFLATANKGPNLNNSEFFITLTKADLSSLNGKHTVFGKVQVGLEVLRKINDSFCDKNNRPQMNIRIAHTSVIYDPFQDLPGMQISVESPKLKKDTERLQAIQHFQMLQKYQNEDDINQTIKKQKAKKQALTLQILGDLPDANIKPPENILFVCKLNPITQQKDLQIIFSRFGPVKSVQIVRDWKTGQSLQYSFIQFQNAKSCQEAYLKMNNVLIDQRRIQVDFSQSVSKLMPKHRKLNEAPKKMIKQSQTGAQKKQKIVQRVGRRADDSNKYNLITSKPTYQTKASYSKHSTDRKYQSLPKQRFDKEQQIREDIKKKKCQSRSQNNTSSVKKDRKQKKEKKRKQKRKRSSSSPSSSQQKVKKRQRQRRNDSSQSSQKKHKKKQQRRHRSRSKEQKRNKKDRSERKTKKQKKDKKKGRHHSQSD